jgi:hypothetical protein
MKIANNGFRNSYVLQIRRDEKSMQNFVWESEGKESQGRIISKCFLKA